MTRYSKPAHQRARDKPATSPPLSYAAITVLPMQNQPNHAPNERKRTIFRPRSAAKATDTSSTVLISAVPSIHHEAMDDDNILFLILNFLKYDLHTLASFVRVSKACFQTGLPFLMALCESEDVVTRIKDSKRRAQCASLMSTLQFWSHEKLSSTTKGSYLKFDHLRRLSLFDSTLRTGDGKPLIHYLAPGLRRFDLWADDQAPKQGPITRGDEKWLKHLSLTCQDLINLTIEIKLEVHSRSLAKFFRSLKALKQLTLGSQVNSAIDRRSIYAIIHLERLEVLELEHELTLATVFFATDEGMQNKILPSIRHLKLKFSEGAGYAPGILLESLRTLNYLELDLGNNTNNSLDDLDPDVFITIGSLESLSLNRLRHLVLNLAIDNLTVSYDIAICIHQLMSDLMHCDIPDLQLSVEESGSDCCPEAGDWVLVLPVGVWLPTNKSYYPDADSWQYRDLPTHSMVHGDKNAIQRQSLLDNMSDEHGESEGGTSRDRQLGFDEDLDHYTELQLESMFHHDNDECDDANNG